MRHLKRLLLRRELRVLRERRAELVLHIRREPGQPHPHTAGMYDELNRVISLLEGME